MRRAMLTHPKTLDLASRLVCGRPAAIGYLILLFDFAAEHAPAGDIGKWPDTAIARGSGWEGDAAQFVTACAKAGWLDANNKTRYIIHDWPQNCENWVRAKLKRLGIEFIKPSENGCAGKSLKKPLKTHSYEASPLNLYSYPYPSSTKKEGGRYAPPSLSEVQAYCDERGYTYDVEEMYAYYDARGWILKSGKPPKKWKQLCVTWNKKQKQFDAGKAGAAVDDILARVKVKGKK